MPTSIQTFFQNYSEALLSYSAKKIAAFYQTPLSVYSDEGIVQVSKKAEIEAFWKKGIEPYKSLGIERTNATVLSEEQLSKTIFISKVIWENYGADDKEVSKETNFYVLSQSGKEYKISGLVIMAK